MKIVLNRYAVLILLIISSILIAGKDSKGDETGESEKVEFSNVWNLVKNNSPARKAAIAESSAADIMASRSGRHWLPRIYAEGRGYATNDAGMNFMSNMGQRSVTAEDFVPDTLNEPGTNFYKRGTIGLDLPLYEGGAGTEGAKGAEKIAEAKRFRMKAIYLSEFSSTASAYGQIIVFMQRGEELKELHRRVSSVLGSYQGGLRANPVEYSGILGLRALKNRIDALRAENEARIASLRDYIDAMSGNGLSAGWLPSGDDAVEFADAILTSGAGSGEASYMVKAYESMAESAKQRARAEKSVFLPRAGLFGEGNIYNGDRDTADSYTAGFYIRMNIFSPTDYGAVKQAELESEAALSKARDARLKAGIEMQRLRRFSDTLKTNIKILKESSAIMDEQIRNSQRLYASGSLRSFQLAEVFSRKADLILNLADAEEQYINVRSGLYNLEGKVDGEVGNGR